MCSLLIAPSGSTRTLWTLAAAAALAVTAPSAAQFGLAGGIGDAFRPAFTTRDMQLAEEMLDLDEAQRFILETLFEDYEAEFNTGIDAFRDQVAEMRTKIDPTDPDPGQVMRIIFGTINDWRGESKVLAEQFIEDLRGLLNEEQMESWPPFERKIFRLKYIRNGQLPAENLDLTVHVQDLEHELGADIRQIQPLMLEYEEALHAALRRREDFLQASQGELINAIQAEDYALGIDVAQRQVALRKEVRDVNEHYAAAIAEALPEDARKTFLDRIRQATYPRVYRTIPAQRAFSAARGIEGITKETQEAVFALERDFLNELESYNQRLVQVIRDHEPEKIKNKVEQATSRLSGLTPPSLQDPTREAFAQRREISDRYMEMLKSLLTPEQFASLPGARRWLSPEERQALGETTPVKPQIPPRMRKSPRKSDQGENAPSFNRRGKDGTEASDSTAEDIGKEREAPKD
jgi:hypothetical protein